MTDQERRCSPRKDLIAGCPTFFEYQGIRYCADMVNLSKTGAGFLMTASEEQPPVFGMNYELLFTIQTPEGSSQVRGEIRWLTSENNTYAFGVEFTAIPDDRSDPLLDYMDSLF